MRPPWQPVEIAERIFIRRGYGQHLLRSSQFSLTKPVTDIPSIGREHIMLPNELPVSGTGVG